MGSNIDAIYFNERICKKVFMAEWYFSMNIKTTILSKYSCKLKRLIDFKWLKLKVVVFIWKKIKA
jgi:hypothetical protein